MDAAFQIMRAHYPQFIMCSAIAYAPWLIAEVLLESNPVLMASIDPEVAVFAGLGIWLVFALMSAVLIVCASQAYLGDPVDVGAAVRKALPRMPLVLAGAIVRYIGMFVGLFFFLIGGIYVAARWFAVTPLIVLERRGVGAALSRSGELSKGQKRHIVNTIGLAAVIYWVLALGLQFAAVFLVRNLILQAVARAVFTILVYPVVAITEALLYFDTRIKQEGFDIEMMTNALDGGGVVQEPAAP